MLNFKLCVLWLLSAVFGYSNLDKRKSKENWVSFLNLSAGYILNIWKQLITKFHAIMLENYSKTVSNIMQWITTEKSSIPLQRGKYFKNYIGANFIVSRLSSPCRSFQSINFLVFELGDEFNGKLLQFTYKWKW